MKKIISAVLAMTVSMSVMTSAAHAQNTSYFTAEISETEEFQPIMKMCALQR